MSLLRMSFAGAAIILVIMIIRALTLYRVPKKTFPALWSIALARLLVPFSIPSALSVYTLLGQKQPAENGAADAFGTIIQQGQLAAAPDAAFSAGVSVCTVIWAAGTVLCAAFFTIAYWKCCREFRASLPVNNDFACAWLQSHQSWRPIQIRCSELVSAPLTFGVFKPVILMPKTTDWGNEQALRYVLTHEFVHIRRFDAVTKIFLTAALCVHWFNPLVWVMYVLANRDMELSCDEAVLRLFGENARALYARTLISMEEAKGGLVPFCNNFSKNALEERLTAIMKTSKITSFSILAAALLVAATAIVFATSAQKEPEPVVLSAGIEKTYTENGKTYYVFWDGTMMEESEYLKEYPTPDIEWWTYDEYKAWLEEEKKELQSIIGQKARVNGEEFVWTQEKVDQTIAMYEEILQEIKEGVKHSKTVDGDEDVLIMQDTGASMTETGEVTATIDA